MNNIVLDNMTYILKSLMATGPLRRVDGTFIYMDIKYKYTAYTIIPKAGEPTIRIDMKADRG